MQLTKNFNLQEFIRSQTASRKGINNTPSKEVVNNIKYLTKNCLQIAREHIGKPFTITSGYRCKELNQAIGGASKSQHCKGEAVDFVCNGLGSSKTLFKAILESGVEFDQIIEEFGQWVHISYKKEGNRNQKLIAKKINGKTVYEEVL